MESGIPITTVPVTLIDISPLLPFDDLAQAVHKADVRHGTTARHIEAALERYPKAKGRKTLLAIASGDAPTLLSTLETSLPVSAEGPDGCRYPRPTVRRAPTTSTVDGPGSA